MNECALCKGKIEKNEEINEGVKIKGWRCKKCGETFFTSTEMLRWEVLTKKRKEKVRKVRKIGNSFVVTLPHSLVKEEKLSTDDSILFEKSKHGLIVKIIHNN